MRCGLRKVAVSFRYDNELEREEEAHGETVVEEREDDR
jgi:hypothetical protein